MWSAPGNHASPKSATAHDDGCSDGRYNGKALHIWTDNPGAPFSTYLEEHQGATTLSLLQAVAYADYDGKVGAAMDALGLSTPMHEIEAETGVDNAGIDSDSEVSSRGIE